MSETGSNLLDALAYLRPHRLTMGPILLDAPKVRSALAVIEAALKVANGKLSPTMVCPFNDTGQEAVALLIGVEADDPCPMCGDLWHMPDSERRCPRQPSPTTQTEE